MSINVSFKHYHNYEHQLITEAAKNSNLKSQDQTNVKSCSLLRKRSIPVKHWVALHSFGAVLFLFCVLVTWSSSSCPTPPEMPNLAFESLSSDFCLWLRPYPHYYLPTAIVFPHASTAAQIKNIVWPLMNYELLANGVCVPSAQPHRPALLCIVHAQILS